MGNTTTQEAIKDDKEFDVTEIVLSDKKLFEIPITFIDVDDQKKIAKFVFKLPNVQDMIRVGIIESQLLEDSKNLAEVSQYILNVAYFIATVKVCLVECPAWFNIDDNDDLDLLEVLYDRYTLAVERFREKRKIVVSK